MRILGWLAALIAAAALSAAPISGRDTPDPSDCRVTPRDPAALVAALATPAADTALPDSVTSEAELPRGEPVAPETLAGVTATVRVYVSCLNAGDLQRAYALGTDNFFRGLFDELATLVGRERFEEAFVTGAASSPEPRAPEQQVELQAVREARMLPDGRIGAVVDVNDATDPPGDSDTSFFVFVKVADHWLIDGIAEIGR